MSFRTEAKALLDAYTALTRAREHVREVPASGGRYSDQRIREIRLELEHMTRRLKNVALARNVPPGVLEGAARAHNRMVPEAAGAAQEPKRGARRAGARSPRG